MLGEKLEEAFNKQMNAELYSAYLYLAMAAYFESLNLPGFAMWLKVQTQEEITHALRFYNFLADRNGRVKLSMIDAPPGQWKSPLGAFEEAHKHEVKVSGLINSLADLAVAEKDHASQVFLQWFVNEQVEEEAQTWKVTEQIKLAKDNPSAMLLLDRELGARTFVMPPELAPTIGWAGAGAGA